MSDHSLYSVNIELTNRCPLHCPQCYCFLEGNKDIDPKTAKLKLQEAARHGVEVVNLSGGETLCYPWLMELISYASELHMRVNIAISGCYFDEDKLKELIDAGVTTISVSLNGSTEEINGLTRDGYQLAMKAIGIIGKSSFRNSFINWVMHSNNSEDFPNVVKIAEENNISNIDVIMFKPDSKNELKSYPSGEQMKKIADYIHYYKGSVKIQVESCFSQMLALVSNYSWIGNLNTGERKGCSAGLYLYNISVDGEYSPCRHLLLHEHFANLDDFLARSPTVKMLENYENDLRDPCGNCSLEKYCRPCAAVAYKLHGSFYKGQESCEVWNLKQSPNPGKI